MMDAIIAVLSKNALVTALAVTGLMMFVSHLLSKYLTKGKLQSSAIAITLGLVVTSQGFIRKEPKAFLTSLFFLVLRCWAEP